MRASSPRLRLLALLTALVVPALAAGPAAAADRSVATPLVGAPGCAAGVAGPGCLVLADPQTPGDDDAAALAALAPTDSPEDDLDDALRRLAAAADADAAAAGRADALAILEGTPLPGRPYSGIPLLNWNAPAKVKTVPAGGTVDVREVRFPGHSMSDAWLLRFEDPSQPYTVRYRISELGGVAGARVKRDGASGRVLGWRIACVSPGAGMRTSIACSASRDASAAPAMPRWDVKRLTSNVPVARLGASSGSSVAGTAPKRSAPSASSGAGRSSPPATPPSSLMR